MLFYFILFYFFWSFETTDRILRVKQSKITGENTCNEDHFEIEGNDGSNKEKKTLFWIFLEISDQCFNP